jgi:hypothetical protein
MITILFKKLYIALLLALLLNTFNLYGKILNVSQNYQSQTNWCWAATSKSVLSFYGYNYTQEQIALYGTDGANEWNWLYGQSTNPTRRGINLILMYFGSISTYSDSWALTLEESIANIEEDKPFFIRWGWTSGGGHFVVTRGIETNMFYLMDPWYGPTINTYDWVMSGSSHTWTHTLEMVNAPQLPSISAIQVRREGNLVIVSWNPVVGANSYQVYSAVEPYPTNWGSPITRVNTTQYSESCCAKKYFRIIASSETLP